MCKVTLIAALARHRAIGHDNELLARLPEDMAHFKALTLKHTIIMGRKTWDSIPARFRPLVERRNIVLSRQKGLSLPGAEVFDSLDAALRACAGEDEVFVMGGAQIYEQALGRADRLALTLIEAEFEADAFFPDYSGMGFIETSRQTQHSPASRGHGWDFHFVRLERRPAA
ncbi:MAG: dihydrofolate reductase [Burkholderiaceae bacterium]|nr:dihydrofolate reductase [Burkholderiaceae bacterium]